MAKFKKYRCIFKCLESDCGHAFAHAGTVTGCMKTVEREGCPECSRKGWHHGRIELVHLEQVPGEAEYPVFLNRIEDEVENLLIKEDGEEEQATFRDCLEMGIGCFVSFDD